MKLPLCSAMVAVQLLNLSARVLSAPAPVMEDADRDASHSHSQSQNTLNLLHVHEDTDVRIDRPVLSDPTQLSSSSLFDSTPPSSDEEPSASSIPSRYTSTLLARRLLFLSSHGDLLTTFPSNLSSSPRTPSSVASTPIGLPEYIASCEEPSGNPTILSLKISTATRNANAGSNVSLSLSWWDEYIHITGRRPWALANLPRLSLTGYLEEMSAEEVSEKGIEGCFVKKHRDSVLWLPDKKWAAHEGFWTRLVVMEVYWIGGFGDKNYIGWLDPEEWKSIKKEDWEGVRLPGEKN